MPKTETLTYLSQFIASKGVSQAEAARLCKIGKSQFNNYTSGKYRPSPENLEKIEKVWPDFDRSQLDLVRPDEEDEEDMEKPGLRELVSYSRYTVETVVSMKTEIVAAKNEVILTKEQVIADLREQLAELKRSPVNVDFTEVAKGLHEMDTLLMEKVDNVAKVVQQSHSLIKKTQHVS